MNLETKITIYKFTPQLSTLTLPNISTLKECFSLIHNILHSVKTGSDSYFCQIKV